MGWWNKIFGNRRTIDFSTVTDSQLSQFIEDYLDLSNSEQFNYTNQDEDGNVIQLIELINPSPMVHKVLALRKMGANGERGLIKPGDSMVLPTDDGDYAFLVLQIEKINSSGLFSAYIVGIDHKFEESKKQK